MITSKAVDNTPFNQSSIDASAGRFIKSLVQLVFSGVYVAAGDVWDLTNAVARAAGTSAQVATNVIPPGVRGLARISIVGRGPVTGYQSIGGRYVPVAPSSAVVIPPSLLATMKVKLWDVAGTEFAAGAYSAAVLADIVIAELHWMR